METREALEQVITKIAELKPQVQLWYRDEGQCQQGLEAGELNGGLYYHDVTKLSAIDGLPLRSTVDMSRRWQFFRVILLPSLMCLSGLIICFAWLILPLVIISRGFAALSNDVISASRTMGATPW